MSDERTHEVKSKARETFWRVAKDGLFRLMDEAPTVWKGREARLYRDEKQMIMKHVDPFYWGFVVTTFLFITFRVSGSRQFARFRDTYMFQKQQPSTPVKPSNWKSHLEAKAESKKDNFEEVVRLPVDILLSLLCGGSSIVWLSDTTALHKDFAEAPLLPKRSLIHRYMCPDLVSAHSQIDPLAFQHVVDDTVLETFDTMVQNCQIRSKYIRQREMEGVERPDVVPYPGLKGVQR